MENPSILSFQFCDFTEEYHCSMVAELINQYNADSIRGVKQLTMIQRLRLVDGLATHPSSLVLLAYREDVIVGMATCFIGFSTLKICHELSIQNIIILKGVDYISLDVAILNECIRIAADRKYGRITIGLRDETIIESLGFDEYDTEMRFGIKSIYS